MAMDFRTMTPGSAVAETIQGILQRRRDESRQALLDKLQHDQVTAQMANDKARLAQGDRGLELEAARNQEAALTGAVQRSEAQERLNRSRLESFQDELPIDKMKPEDAQLARERGYVQTSQPKVSSSYGTEEEMIKEAETAAGAPSEIFITPKKREELSRKQDIENYIKNHADALAKKPDLMQLLTMRAETGMEVPLPTELLGPPPSIRLLGPNDRGTVNLQYGQTAHVQGHAPIPPAAYQAPQEYFLPNPQDNGRFWSAWLKPGDSPDKATFIGPAPSWVTGSGPAGNISPNPTNVQDPGSAWVRNMGTAGVAAQKTTGQGRDAAIATWRNTVMAGPPNLSPAGKTALSTISADLNRRMMQGTLPTQPNIARVLSEAKGHFPNLTDSDLIALQNTLQVLFSPESVQ